MMTAGLCFAIFRSIRVIFFTFVIVHNLAQVVEYAIPNRWEGPSLSLFLSLSVPNGSHAAFLSTNRVITSNFSSLLCVTIGASISAHSPDTGTAQLQ